MFSFEKLLVNTSHKNHESHIEFMKLYERLINFELNFPNTFLNAKMTNITNVDLDEWTKLGIRDFSS
jgi:hypothetical protein